MFDRWRGGVLMGRRADRFSVVVPAVLGALMLGIGYVAAASATPLWQFMLAQALLIGMLGSSATFGPRWSSTSRSGSSGIFLAARARATHQPLRNAAAPPRTIKMGGG